MSGFNGSGTFNISGVGLPYVSGTTISSSVANQLNTDLATGLSTCITKDGQSTITANIGWNNFNINNLSALGIGTAAPLGQMEVKSGSTTNFIIDSSGNVGIGVSSLSYKLQVLAGYPGVGFFRDADVTSVGAASQAIEIGAKNGSTQTAGASLQGVLNNPATTGEMAFLTRTSNVLTEKMRIDSSGNVGINTSSPLGKFSVYSTHHIGFNVGTIASPHAGNLYYDTDGTGWDFQIGKYQSSAFTAQMTFTDSGNVGIGTSSPAQKLEIAGTTSTTLARNSTTTAANGFNAANTSGNFYFGIDSSAGAFYGTTAYGRAIYSDGAYPISIYTAASERMRIDTNGYALIGYTSSNGAYRLQVNSQIFATSSTIATSDGKYKENVNTLENALDLVCALNPVSFDWKQHPVHNFDRSTTTTGFIAQEVQTALQNTAYVNAIVKTNTCVLEPEEKDADGNVTKPAVTEEFLGIAEGNLIAILTKAVQELKTELDTVKTELAALKGS